MTTTTVQLADRGIGNAWNYVETDISISPLLMTAPNDGYKIVLEGAYAACALHPQSDISQVLIHRGDLTFPNGTPVRNSAGVDNLEDFFVTSDTPFVGLIPAGTEINVWGYEHPVKLIQQNFNLKLRMILYRQVPARFPGKRRGQIHASNSSIAIASGNPGDPGLLWGSFPAFGYKEFQVTLHNANESTVALQVLGFKWGFHSSYVFSHKVLASVSLAGTTGTVLKISDEDAPFDWVQVITASGITDNTIVSTFRGWE